MTEPKDQATGLTRRRFAELAGTAMVGGVVGATSTADARARRVVPLAQPTTAVPFGMYSMPPDRMGELAEAGFAWAGPFYPRELDATPGRVAAAADAGLGVIHPVGRHHKGSLGRDPFPYDLRTARREMAASIERLSEDPTIAAWYVLPEELRPHERPDRAYLNEMAKVIAERDPLRRPVTQYQPNARSAAGLGQMSAPLDWVTKGTYTNYAGHREQRAWVRWSTEQIVRASGEHQLPISTLEMFQQPAPADEAAIERWVRHDTFAALVSGAKGIWVFSGWRRPRFDAYDAYFDAYRDVARLLNGPLGLGRDLLAAGPAFELAAAYGPAHVDVQFKRTTARYSSVAAVVRRHGDEATMVVVNSANAAVRVRPKGMDGAVELLGAAQWNDRRAELELPPLGVAALRRPA